MVLRLPGIEFGAVQQFAGIVHGEHVVDLGLRIASVQRVHVFDFQTVGQRFQLTDAGQLLRLVGRDRRDHGAYHGRAQPTGRQHRDGEGRMCRGGNGTSEFCV